MRVRKLRGEGVVDAVRQEGGAEALVDQVLCGGASGSVVLVPGVGAGLDDLRVLIGQGEHLGAEAVPHCIHA